MEATKAGKSKELTKEKTGRIELSLENLPFPAVTLSKDGNLLFRNRLAKKLLPPPSRLGRFLAREWNGAKEKAIFTATLEGTSYFVGLTRWEERTVFSFLETPLPLHPVFSRALLERARELLPDFDRAAARLLDEGSGGRKDPERLDRLSARIRRLREEEGAYLRLMRLSERSWDSPVSIGLFGFFRSLTAAMQKARVTLFVTCPSSAVSWVSPSVLGFVMVNLFHFITLFEGEDKIRVLVEAGEKESVIDLYFPDREGLFSLYGTLTGERGEEYFPQALAFAPLFCAMAVCRDSGLVLRLLKRGDEGVLRLTLPAAPHMPEVFLGAKGAEIEVEMERWIREIFLNFGAMPDGDGLSSEKK